MGKIHQLIGEISPYLFCLEMMEVRPDTGPVQALLVEDDPFTRKAVADFLLEEMNFQVHVAASYEEAREMVNRLVHQCKLALVDVSLPPFSYG